MANKKHSLLADRNPKLLSYALLKCLVLAGTNYVAMILVGSRIIAVVRDWWP